MIFNINTFTSQFDQRQRLYYYVKHVVCQCNLKLQYSLSLQDIHNLKKKLEFQLIGDRN